MMRLALPRPLVRTLALAALSASCASASAAESSSEGGQEIGGVTIYRKITFDQSEDAWSVSDGAKLALSRDAADGRALRVDCQKGWAACELPIRIAGSRGLKIAVLMQGRNLESAGINVFDAVAGDNTTAYGYGYLKESGWTGIVYHLDEFRYNSQASSVVAPDTQYTSVRFYAPQQIQPETWFALDNFAIYRGADRQPPAQVQGLSAKATSRGVELAWNAAQDNVATQLYVIARADGGGSFRKIAENCATSYLDASAGKGTCHYRVFAVDFEENFGLWSEPVTVRAAAAPQAVTITREQEDRANYAEHVRQVHARGAGKVRRNHATLFGDSLTAATVYPQCAQAAFGNLTVRAFGFPAMRTSFARTKVAEILREDNPEFLFILYGTNNDKAESSLAAAMEDLAAVVQACEANGTVAVLGTIPPRGWTPDSTPEAAFNRELVELCRRLHIPTGYIFEAFQAAGPENRKTYMGGDGVHWTGAGMALAGRAWARTLDQLRFVLRDRE